MTNNSVTSLATDGKVLVATVLGSHNLFMFKVKKLQFVVLLKTETHNPMTPESTVFSKVTLKFAQLLFISQLSNL